MTTTTDSRRADLDHVLTILAVDDLSRAVGFYRAAFGWEQTVDAPSYAELRMPSGMRLGLYERAGFAANTGVEPPRTPPGAITSTELYFHAADLDAAIGRLEAAGARLLRPRTRKDWGDEAAYFADPDGNVLVVARPIAG